MSNRGFTTTETSADCDECGHDLLQHHAGCDFAAEGCPCTLTFTKTEARRIAAGK